MDPPARAIAALAATKGCLICNASSDRADTTGALCSNDADEEANIADPRRN
jgi:hypothetical protein